MEIQSLCCCWHIKERIRIRDCLWKHTSLCHDIFLKIKLTAYSPKSYRQFCLESTLRRHWWLACKYHKNDCKTKYTTKIWQKKISVYNYIVELISTLLLFHFTTWKTKSQVLKLYVSKENRFGYPTSKKRTQKKQRTFWNNDQRRSKKSTHYKIRSTNIYFITWSNDKKSDHFKNCTIDRKAIFSKLHVQHQQTCILCVNFPAFVLTRYDPRNRFETIRSVCRCVSYSKRIRIFRNDTIRDFIYTEKPSEILTTNWRLCHKKRKKQYTRKHDRRNITNRIDRLLVETKLISVCDSEIKILIVPEGIQKDRRQSWTCLNSCSWWKQCTHFETEYRSWIAWKNHHEIELRRHHSTTTPWRQFVHRSKHIKTAYELYKNQKKTGSKRPVFYVKQNRSVGKQIGQYGLQKSQEICIWYIRFCLLLSTENPM